MISGQYQASTLKTNEVDILEAHCMWSTSLFSNKKKVFEASD